MLGLGLGFRAFLVWGLDLAVAHFGLRHLYSGLGFGI